jgi:hypothetical protein
MAICAICIWTADIDAAGTLLSLALSSQVEERG